MLTSQAQGEDHVIGEMNLNIVRELTSNVHEPDLVNEASCFKSELETVQENVISSSFDCLRKIGKIQYEVQSKVKRDVDWMKKLVYGHNEYIII